MKHKNRVLSFGLLDAVLMLPFHQAVSAEPIVYQCQGKKHFEVEYSQGIAQIKFAGQPSVMLKQIRSASGSRYGKKRIPLPTKGNGAFVEVNGKQVLEQCVAEDVRDDYAPMDLKQIPPNRLSDIDPKIAVIKAFGRRESAQLEGLRSEALEITYLQPTLSVAILTVDGLADDSIRAKKYRAELALQGNQWTIIWAGTQVRCQDNRGHSGWSNQSCL